MVLSPLISVLLAVTSLASGAGDDRGSLFESGDVVGLELPERPGSRTEHFALRIDGETVGVARAYLGCDESRVRVELSFDLFEVETRVVHVEELDEGGPRLVWREVRKRSGRTTLVRWSPDGEHLTRVDWSGGDALRSEDTPPSGALLPLFLVGRARAGEFPRGVFDVFDPLTGRVDEWHAEVARGVALGGGPSRPRRLQFLRTDETLAGEYVFLGEELVAFRLQRGGPVAVRVTRSAFEDAVAEHRELRAVEAGTYSGERSASARAR